MRELKWRGRHGMVCLWPYQSVNIPVGKHRILLIARGRLDKRARFRPWQIQVEIMQLFFCCGRSR